MSKNKQATGGSCTTSPGANVKSFKQHKAPGSLKHNSSTGGSHKRGKQG